MPAARNRPHVPISTAMVMPDSGLLVEPTSPVTRELTTENRKPNTRISGAPTQPIWNTGTTATTVTSASAPNSSTGIGVSRSVRVVLPLPPPNSDFAECASADQIAGSARTSAKMPPVATAPAPMWRT